jgi:hypothetical protein
MPFFCAAAPPWGCSGFLALAPMPTVLVGCCVLWRVLGISTVEPTPRAGA